MARRIPVSLVVAALIISFPLVLSWVREKGPSPLIMAERQIKDCDQWAGMNVKQKKRNYRADPEKWARCLYAGQDSEFNRLYITGKVSR